jgi:flavocytochrome c
MTIPLQPDVIIIGSGFAGLTAAIECATLGFQVLVLEKMKAIGGNSILSDGGIAAPETSLQQRHGIIDSTHAFYEDMMRSARGANDPKLCALVAQGAREAFEWTQTLGVPYQDRVDIFGGHRVKRCYSPDPLSGSTILLKMKARCDELGVSFRFGIQVTGFIQENHRIAGVICDPDYRFLHPQTQPNLVIRSTRAVIVASGGYAADLPFLNALDQRITPKTLTTNKRSATAEVLRSCMAIGAQTRLMDTVQWMPWSTPDEPGYGIGGLFGDYIVSAYGILIDPNTGHRFVNEQNDRRVITESIQAIGPWVIGLVDQRAVTDAGWDLTRALHHGIVKTHPDLKSVALMYQIPLEALQKTLNAYHELFTHATPDVLGKKVEPWMNPLLSPPYYTMRIQPKTHYCPGGLVIDPDLHVMDGENHPIPGLYAVGEVTGMTHGLNRLGSCSVTECIVLGRRVAHVIHVDGQGII